MNLGNPREMTVLDFAETIIRLTASRAASSTARCPSTTRRSASPTSAWRASCCGWEPMVDVEDGLRTTIEYFRGKIART